MIFAKNVAMIHVIGDGDKSLESMRHGSLNATRFRENETMLKCWIWPPPCNSGK